MNFYKHHIGDYDQATRHLSFVEDAAYCRLIRKYYAEEGPLPKDLKKVQKLIAARTKEEKAAVETVLEEFFTLEEDGWHQSRCDEELEVARVKAERNRQVGKLGGRPKKVETQTEPTGNPDGYETETQTVSENNPSQTPDSRLQTPEITTTTPNGVVVDSDPAADFSLDGGARKRPDCPHQEIIALYHELLPMCPSIRDWTANRAQALRARWNEDQKRQNLDYWRRFFAYIAESEFLTGRARTTDSRKPFFAGLDWIVKSENFTKIREGRYHSEEVAA